MTTIPGHRRVAEVRAGEAAPGRRGAVRVRAVVAGRVQGVGFRESCRREADRVGVAGWVANRSDGSVVIEAEGERPAVDALMAWARRGPLLAHVTDVRIEQRTPEGASRFLVR